VPTSPSLVVRPVRKRQTIYTFMLRHLSDEHKFQLMSKLSLELLAAAVEGELDVREERPAQLVADALFVLSSKVRVDAHSQAGGRSLDPGSSHPTLPRSHCGPRLQDMKLSAVKSAQEIEEEADAAGAAAGTSSETAAAEAALATARSKVLSKVRRTPPAPPMRAIRLRQLTGAWLPFYVDVARQLARRSMMELMLPVLVALKRHLERLHSPLLKRLMAFFYNVVRDFRVEMDDLMTANRQLAQEIEFDLRQYEKQQAAHAAAAASSSSPAQSSPYMNLSPQVAPATIQRFVSDSVRVRLAHRRG